MPRKATTETKNERQIFDSFMEFLRSDLWLIPVSQFMEQRSLVFEREPDISVVPDTAECYQAVHKEFGGMVSDLLNAFCQDSGLQRERLMEALKATDRTQGLTQKERMLLEPIVAAHDFDVFVPMMMRKNIELQLQALKMIEHMKGLVPNALKLGQEDAEIWDALFEEEESDRLILISVLKQSKEEWERDQRMRKDWQEQMDAAIRESLDEKIHLEGLHRREQELLEQALSKADNSFNLDFKSLSLVDKAEDKNYKSGAAKAVDNHQQKPAELREVRFKEEQPTHVKQQTMANPEPVKDEPPKDKPSSSALLTAPNEKQKLRRSSQVEVESAAKDAMKGNGQQGTKEKRLSLGQLQVPIKGIAKDRENTDKGDLAYRALLKQREGIPEENLQHRMRYLREQRDKLLQKKSREREKQFMEATKRTDESRPRTAQAARGLMEQSVANELEERRRIAAKIKAQVIDKSVALGQAGERRQE